MGPFDSDAEGEKGLVTGRNGFWPEDGGGWEELGQESGRGLEFWPCHLCDFGNIPFCCGTSVCTTAKMCELD